VNPRWLLIAFALLTRRPSVATGEEASALGHRPDWRRHPTSTRKATSSSGSTGRICWLTISREGVGRESKDGHRR